MLADIVTFTDTELNTATEVTKEILDKELSKESLGLRGKSNYAPTSVLVENMSGNTIFFHIFTNLEKEAWVLDNDLSEGIVLLNGGTKLISGFRDEVQWVIAKGTTGHTGGLVFTFLQEGN